jgi:integrase
VLCLLARLGLRSGEVAALQLGDIDWRRGEIVVRGKARRRDRPPLPADVGAALAAYLREDRPRCADRQVIHTLYAPPRPIHPSSITNVVRPELQVRSERSAESLPSLQPRLTSQNPWKCRRQRRESRGGRIKTPKEYC